MTRTTKRRGLIALSLSIMLLAGLWFAGPTLLRAYIARRFSGVTVGRVEIATQGLTLYDVLVVRDGVRAQLPEVFVGRDKVVWVKGGAVTVDYDALSKGSASSGSRPKILGSLDTLSVKRGAVSGRASKVVLDDKNVCFTEASTSHGIGVISVDSGCLALDRTTVTFRKATLVPKWAKVETVVVGGASIALDASDITLDTLTYGKAYALSGVRLRRTGTRVSTTITTARVDNPIVYPTPVTLHQLAVDLDIPADVSADEGGLRKVLSIVENQATVWVGGAAFQTAPKKLSVNGSETCQAWLDAMPVEMRVGPLASTTYTGRLGFSISIRPVPEVKIESSCRASCAAFAPLRSTFEYTAYDAKGQPFTRTTGPKSKDWTPLSAMSPTIPQAVMALEDSAFRSHKGFIVSAIENSLKANLAADKFVRGGSTITMQLAKNLWLRRDKALARKAQEILLATAIESCLSKDEIIELYLNVVEFGPDLYGIGAATRHYFSENPGVIQPVQAFFLASILPAPRKATVPTAETLVRIEKLMRRLASNGALPDDIVIPEEGAVNADGPVDTTGWKVNQ